MSTKGAFHPRALAVLVALVVTARFESKLTHDYTGRLCSAAGKCLAGWQCDHSSGLCVRPDALHDKPGDAPDAQSAAPINPPAVTDATIPMANCAGTQTDCAGACVDVQ